MPIVIPLNGLSFSNCFLMEASTGMYCAAQSIFNFPGTHENTCAVAALRQLPRYHVPCT